MSPTCDVSPEEPTWSIPICIQWLWMPLDSSRKYNPGPADPTVSEVKTSEVCQGLCTVLTEELQLHSWSINRYSIQCQCLIEVHLYFIVYIMLKSWMIMCICNVLSISFTLFLCYFAWIGLKDLCFKVCQTHYYCHNFLIGH